MATPQANSKYVDAMAALAAAAEEGDERARAAMKKMAAAVEDKKDADGDKPAPDAAKAEDKNEPEAKAELPEKSASASADAATVEAIAARVSAHMTAQATERRTLLASRADLMVDPAIKAMLETASLETIREVCKTTPKAELKAPAAPVPTLGATAGTPAGLPADESAELKARMGLTPHPTAAVRKFGVDLTIFGATEEQAAKIAAERGF